MHSSLLVSLTPGTFFGVNVLSRCEQNRLDEMLKAASSTADSLQEHPTKADSIHCAFNKHHKVPIFDYYTKFPDRGARFAKAMAGATRSKWTFGELGCTRWR